MLASASGASAKIMTVLPYTGSPSATCCNAESKRDMKSILSVTAPQKNNVATNNHTAIKALPILAAAPLKADAVIYRSTVNKTFTGSATKAIVIANHSVSTAFDVVKTQHVRKGHKIPVYQSRLAYIMSWPPVARKHMIHPSHRTAHFLSTAIASNGRSLAENRMRFGKPKGFNFLATHTPAASLNTRYDMTVLASVLPTHNNTVTKTAAKTNRFLASISRKPVMRIPVSHASVSVKKEIAATKSTYTVPFNPAPAKRIATVSKYIIPTITVIPTTNRLSHAFNKARKSEYIAYASKVKRAYTATSNQCCLTLPGISNMPLTLNSGNNTELLFEGNKGTLRVKATGFAISFIYGWSGPPSTGA